MKYFILFFGVFFCFLLYLAHVMLWYKEDNKNSNQTYNEFCVNENYLKNVSIKKKKN